MPLLELGPEDALHYEHEAPEAGGATFVFVNALTGATTAWNGTIATRLRAAGHGFLAWDFRGQGQSRHAAGTALTPELIVDDMMALLAATRPMRPIFCGLSIGGLFAAQGILRGAEAAGLVLLNTLRKPGLRLDWIMEANARIAGVGGFELLLDGFLPLLVNGEALEAMRAGRLGEAAYRPLAADDPRVSLMAEAESADWDLAYEALTAPTLVVTGLADRVFYDADDVAELLARLPNGREIAWADCGHLVPLERPERLAEALIAFAAEIAS